uniref:Uncharacterized protein n=1 Tax=Pyxicephalus adspersus TaxID=30357 RepID=A0AAV2ZJ28_PYXAD|nr:TPA: hypothetical protein GDO54_003073 [Pyxicephalus adspersus]
MAVKCVSVAARMQWRGVLSVCNLWHNKFVIRTACITQYPDATNNCSIVSNEFLACVSHTINSTLHYLLAIDHCPHLRCVKEFDRQKILCELILSHTMAARCGVQGCRSHWSLIVKELEIMHYLWLH